MESLLRRLGLMGWGASGPGLGAGAREGGVASAKLKGKEVAPPPRHQDRPQVIAQRVG